MRIPKLPNRAAAAVAGAAIGLSAAVPRAAAQTVPLANVLPELILRDVVLDSPPISGIFLGVQNPDDFTHAAHFSPLQTNELRNPVVGIVHGFNTQLATQFATFPLGSSTGGLTYEFDTSIGTLQRRSSSFGPLFGERALTVGRRKLSVGFYYQRISFDTFEGQGLDDGSIKFYLRHEDCCDIAFTPGEPVRLLDEPNGTRISPPFENDLIEASLSVKAASDTAAVFANYGLTDRWDIGIAIPVVSVRLEAAVTARIIRFNTVTNPWIHTFDVNDIDAPLVLRSGGRATGIGDIVLRSKYRVLRLRGGGVAAAIDVRLPTGDEQNLLGTGGTQAKFAVIASDERGRFGHHAAFGYTASNGEVAGAMPGLTPASLPDEINYSGGLEVIAAPRVTLNVDVIGRTLRDAGRLSVVSREFKRTVLQPGNCEGTFFDCAPVFFDEFEPRPSNLTLVLGTAGAKVNVARNLLVSGSVLFPLSKAGLRSRVATMLGLDYTF